MKIAVVYKSKYGTTKQYAEWVAAELDADLFEIAEIKPVDLTVYDVVIHGGGLYGGGIDGLKITKRKSPQRLVVFTVGVADPITTDYSEILQLAFSTEELTTTKVFHLRGGIDYKKLNFAHKTIMGMMQKALLKKNADKRSEEEQQILATYGKKVDFVDRTTIEPLVDYIKSLDC